MVVVWRNHLGNNGRMSLLLNTNTVWRQRAERFSDSKYGIWVLGLIAFADSSVLPVLPDLLLIPMIMLRPERALLLSAMCVVASSLGALVGYAIGYWFWAAIGQPIIEMYNHVDNFLIYQRLVEQWGGWIIIAKSFTPIPFKIVAIAAGVAAMNFFKFSITALIGRFLHFAIVGILVVYWGPQFIKLTQKYERALVGLAILAMIAIIVVYLAR
jgi:membrane protein YqaA with SNARE-associated domain